MICWACLSVQHFCAPLWSGLWELSVFRWAHQYQAWKKDTEFYRKKFLKTKKYTVAKCHDLFGVWCGVFYFHFLTMPLNDMTNVNTFQAGQILCLSTLVMLVMPYKGKKLLKGNEKEKNCLFDVFAGQPNDRCSLKNAVIYWLAEFFLLLTKGKLTKTDTFVSRPVQ